MKQTALKSVPSSHYCLQNTLIQLSQFRAKSTLNSTESVESCSVGSLQSDFIGSARLTDRKVKIVFKNTTGPAAFFCTPWMPLTTSLGPQPVAVMERGRKLRTLEAYSVQQRTLRKLIVVFALMARLLPKLPMLF